MEIVLSFAEFIGLILGFVALVVLVYIIIYEYRLWRRKRATKLLVRPAEQ